LTTRALLLLLGTLVGFASSPGQLHLSGQASPAYVKSDAGTSQYIIDEGRATFAWRFDLFADAAISDHIFFLSNVRMVQDQIVHVDLFSLKFTDLTPADFNIEAGEIDLPFGNLGERRFPRTNPFYTLPLLHEHLTSLRSSNYGLFTYDSRYTSAGDGIRILDQGLYDLGVKLYGGLGIFDYWVAVTNGMLSATSSYSTGYGSPGLNANRGLGTIVRLAATPITGLTIGSAYATGPFLPESNASIYGVLYNPSDIKQHALEGDIDFSIEHFSLYAEVVHNVWTFSDVYGKDLTATGYSIEGRYTPVPRVTLAARAGEIFFNDILVGNLVEPLYIRWDRNILRLEGALGYRLDRAALVKLIYVSNTTLGVTEDPPDNSLIVQAVVSF
jgi:hypothetical protein